MSDVIRDVVLRLAIEQQQSQIKTPDIAPILQAQKAVTENAQKEAQNQKNEAAHQRLLEIASHEQYYASLRAMMQQEAEAGGRMISLQRAEQTRAWEAAREQAKLAIDVQTAGFTRISGAIGEAATIAQQLGRAYALLGLASGKDTEEVLKMLGAVEGLKAGYDGISGILSVLATKTGVWGVIIAGVAVTATALYKTMKDIQQAAVLNTDEGARGGQLDAQIAEAKHRNALTPQERILEAQERRARVGEGPFENQRKIDEEFAHRIRTAGQRFQNRDLRRDQMGESDQLADLRKERDELQKILKEQQGPGDVLGNTIEKQRVVAERLKEIEKERERILKNQADSINKQVEEQQKALELAKKLADEERRRVESVEERLGSMSELEFAEAEALAKKIKAGQATREDLLRGKALGLEDQFGDEIHEGLQGVGRGRRERLEGLGGKRLRGFGSDLNRAEAEEAIAGDNVAELEKALDAAAAREEKQMERLKAAILRWLDAREAAQNNAFDANKRAIHE